MRVELLLSVVEGDVKTILSGMGLECPAVVINQCDRMGMSIATGRGGELRIYDFPERGVGRSRNEAILRARGEILLFGDGDMEYYPGYAQKIEEEFDRHPEADMLLFNVEVEQSRSTYWNTGYKRVRWYNAGRYGAVSFAIRRKALLDSGVMFSLLFGGGARYGSGEDSLFLQRLLERGMAVYTSPVCIGRERPGQSSWFQGYTEKFFYDKGVLYRHLYGGGRRGFWPVLVAKCLGRRFVFARRRQWLDRLSWQMAVYYLDKGVELCPWSEAHKQEG